MTRARTTLAAGSVVLAALTAGLMSMPRESKSSVSSGRLDLSDGQNIVTQAGYPLPNDLESMVSFDYGNTSIATVTVIREEPARWNSPDGTAPADYRSGGIHFIYTPVRVRVDSVIRGSDISEGDEITVRRYEGTVGDVTYVWEGGPSQALLEGQRAVVFLDPVAEPDDGTGHRVPNAAYRLEEDRTLVSADGDYRDTLDRLLSLVGRNLGGG